MPSGSGSRLKSCSGKSVTKARSWISVEDANRSDKIP